MSGRRPNYCLVAFRFTSWIHCPIWSVFIHPLRKLITAVEGHYPVSWRNRITIKSRTYQSGADKMVELRTAPAAPLRYTTDGSDPKICGAAYDGPFVVPPGTLVVLAVAEKQGIVSDCYRL